MTTFSYPSLTTAAPQNPPFVTSPDNGQALQDYSSPTPLILNDELAQKLSTTGNTGTFQNLSNNYGLSAQNGQYAVTDASTGATVGSAGTVTTGGQVSSSLVGSSGNTDPTQFFVTLTPLPAVGGSSDTVTFLTMPSINESRNVQYRAAGIIQHPGEILKYETTGARTFNITVELIARTSAEATNNKRIINLLRSWQMPFYGTGTAKAYADKLGAPPPVLILKAYGQGMIGPVSCVMENADWVWQNDVDYIPTNESTPTPFPTVLRVTMNLRETWTPAEFSSFDLSAYRSGDLTNAFGGGLSATQSSGGTASGSNSGSPGGVDTSQPVVVSSDALASANVPQPDLSSSLPSFNLTNSDSGVLSTIGGP